MATILFHWPRRSRDSLALSIACVSSPCATFCRSVWRTLTSNWASLGDGSSSYVGDRESVEDEEKWSSRSSLFYHIDTMLESQPTYLFVAGHAAIGASQSGESGP